MDRLLLGVGVALVLGVSGLIWHQSTRPHTPPAASDPSSINDESTPDHGDFPKVELPLPATKSSLDSRIAQSANTLNPFAHLPQSRIGMALESDPFVAESSQEQQWLDRNGFPNSEQWKAYSSAPDGLLSKRPRAATALPRLFWTPAGFRKVIWMLPAGFCMRAARAHCLHCHFFKHTWQGRQQETL